MNNLSNDFILLSLQHDLEDIFQIVNCDEHDINDIMHRVREGVKLYNFNSNLEFKIKIDEETEDDDPFVHIVSIMMDELLKNVHVEICIRFFKTVTTKYSFDLHPFISELLLSLERYYTFNKSVAVLTFLNNNVDLKKPFYGFKSAIHCADFYDLPNVRKLLVKIVQ
jgi:hypothetical protein